MNKKLVDSLWRIFIGFVAAGSAAVVPRLVAQLTLQDEGALTLFSPAFIVIACVFALLVGVIVAILEYGVVRSPRDTFMTALGIPALLAGALTTSDGANRISAQRSELQQLSRQVSELAGVPRNETELEFAPVEPAPSPSGHWIEPVIGIGVANAAGAADTSPAQQFGYAVRESYYMVVLSKTSSARDAETRAAALKRNNVDARVMRAGENFYVTSGGARPEGEAVQEAIRIKERKLPGVNVSLVRAWR